MNNNLRLRAWRSLMWIAVSTLLLTVFVTTASILTLGLTQMFSPASLATQLKGMAHSLQPAVLAMLHSAPVMITCQTMSFPVGVSPFL